MSNVKAKISFQDEKNGVLWLSGYNAKQGEDGKVSHSFQWSKEKQNGINYNIQSARNIASYFLNALNDIKRENDSYVLKVVKPYSSEIIANE